MGLLRMFFRVPSYIGLGIASGIAISGGNNPLSYMPYGAIWMYSVAAEYNENLFQNRFEFYEKVSRIAQKFEIESAAFHNLFLTKILDYEKNGNDFAPPASKAEAANDAGPPLLSSLSIDANHSEIPPPPAYEEHPRGPQALPLPNRNRATLYATIERLYHTIAELDKLCDDERSLQAYCGKVLAILLYITENPEFQRPISFPQPSGTLFSFPDYNEESLLEYLMQVQSHLQFYHMALVMSHKLAHWLELRRIRNAAQTFDVPRLMYTHKDHKPSTSVFQRDDSKGAVFFSGWSLQSVMKQLGLKDVERATKVDAWVAESDPSRFWYKTLDGLDWLFLAWQRSMRRGNEWLHNYYRHRHQVAAAPNLPAGAGALLVEDFKFSLQNADRARKLLLTLWSALANNASRYDSRCIIWDINYKRLKRQLKQSSAKDKEQYQRCLGLLEDCLQLSESCQMLVREFNWTFPTKEDTTLVSYLNYAVMTPRFEGDTIETTKERSILQFWPLSSFFNSPMSLFGCLALTAFIVYYFFAYFGGSIYALSESSNFFNGWYKWLGRSGASTESTNDLGNPVASACAEGEAAAEMASVDAEQYLYTGTNPLSQQQPVVPWGIGVSDLLQSVSLPSSTYEAVDQSLQYFYSGVQAVAPSNPSIQASFFPSLYNFSSSNNSSETLPYSFPDVSSTTTYASVNTINNMLPPSETATQSLLEACFPLMRFSDDANRASPSPFPSTPTPSPLTPP